MSLNLIVEIRFEKIWKKNTYETLAYELDEYSNLKKKKEILAIKMKSRLTFNKKIYIYKNNYMIDSVMLKKTDFGFCCCHCYIQ